MGTKRGGRVGGWEGGRVAEAGVGEFISWLLCAERAGPSEPRAAKAAEAREHRDGGDEVKVKEEKV